MIATDYNGRIVTVNGSQYIVTTDIGEGWSYGALINGTSEQASELFVIFTDGQ